MDFIKLGSEIELLQQLQQSMSNFQLQLNELSLKVLQLEHEQQMANQSQAQSLCKNLHSPTPISFPSCPAQAPTPSQSQEVIRLDGRIDLLNGKINLVKHELNQLLVINTQHPHLETNSSGSGSGSGTWDVALTGKEPDDFPHHPLIKAEPEVVLNEYDEEDGGSFLAQNEVDDEDEDDDDPDYKDPGQEQLESTSTTFAELKSIEKNSHGKFTCPSCPIECKSKKDLSRHYGRHVAGGVRSYRCDMCDAIFNRKDNWTAHVKRKHLPVRAPPLPTSLQPSRIHMNPKPVLLPKGEKQCPICAKTFTRRGHAIRHMQTHTTYEKLSCVACRKTYSRRDKLRAHQREKHGKVFEDGEIYIVEVDSQDQDKPAQATTSTGDGESGKKVAAASPPALLHECPECAKSFNQKSKLDRHLVGCRGLKPFKCDECGKCFTQKSALIQHRASIHQGVKRFLCAECGSCFYGSTNYKKHVRSHTGLKPYPCSVCQRHFNGRSDLKRHERIHTGIRNYACTQCELKFIRRDALTKHQLVHTGEKPWMCDLCGSSFSQSGSMRKHRETCSIRVNEGRRLIIARKPRVRGLLTDEDNDNHEESSVPISLDTVQFQQQHHHEFHHEPNVLHNVLNPQIPNPAFAPAAFDTRFINF